MRIGKTVGVGCVCMCMMWGVISVVRACPMEKFQDVQISSSSSLWLRPSVSVRISLSPVRLYRSRDSASVVLKVFLLCPVYLHGCPDRLCVFA